MQMQRTASYSNIKTHLEPEWNEEQQRLLEVQKTNRAKVHKFSLQTIRRQKALQERHREDEEKERRFSEKVLQERKLKQQDATERFQRAHLLSSQRRQNITGHKKQTTQLTEALQQIHSSFYMSNSPLSAVAKPTVSKGTTDLSPTPTTHGETRKVCHNKSQLSATKAYAKLMQEKSGVNLKNSRLCFQQELEETQRLLGEQQLNSLLEFQKEINQLNQTQSLSSLDSLEIEGQNVVHTSLNDSFGSGTREALPLKTGHISAWINDLNHWRTPISSSGNTITNGTEASTAEEHLSDKLHTFASTSTESKHLDSSSASCAEIHQNTHLTKCFNSNQYKAADSHFNSVLKYPTSTESSESLKGQSAYSATIPCNAWSTPDPNAREITPCSEVNGRVENELQRKAASFHPLKLPFATPIFLHPESQMASDRAKTDSVNDSQKIHQAHQQMCVGATIRSIHSPFMSNKNMDISSDTEDKQASLNKYNSNVKMRQNSAAASQKSICSQVPFNTSEPDSVTNMTEGKENEPVNTSRLKANKNSIPEKKVKILKGILKKVSKYGNSKTKSPLSACNVLGIHIASSIRDSLELKKMKDVETDKKPTKKKLRWLDEIDQSNQIKKEKDEATGEELGSTADIKSSELTSQNQLQTTDFQNNDHDANVNSNVNNNESKWNTLNTNQKVAVNYDLSGHQLNETWGNITMAVPAISETVSASNGLISAVPSDYHFAKRSWTATGTRSLYQKMNEKSNVAEPEKSLRGKRHAKMVRRAHSAKVCSGRKGTIIRPLSASELINSQGKVMVPHPPPKPATDSKQSQRTAVSYNSSCQSQVHSAHVIDACSDTSVKVTPLDKGTNENSIISDLQPQLYSLSNKSDNTITFPSSYLVGSYETISKETCSVNATQEHVSNGTKQDPFNGENTMRLDSTPTYEQIALLWHRVRDALAKKDIATVNSQNNLSSNKGHTTNLQPHRTSISHLTIDGGSLLNGTQSVSRVGQLFSAPSGDRRKHPIDTYSNATKYKAPLEQRRMISSSSASKSDQIRQNIQIQPFRSVFNPVKAVSAVQNTKEAVSESTKQFMLAENLVETSAVDTDILAAMDSLKTQQHAFLENNVQQSGLSALSFEEKKLLQSLDRLNQRLKCIQETVEASPCNGLLQIPSPFITPYGISSSGWRPVKAICGPENHHNVTACAQIQTKYSRNKTK
ncbi:centrosomal protein of 126 kDa isoform X1 [Hypanus sabinus]|uniref:centrosomal protein of 126 kDa isoform X1 n=1 Tax=Hypanus sabinus TaxID=79690 RepID=UPI0028C48A30|nr:centrosomal protein of 126 kDa isoform X1 [Hypanus sabinus]